MSATELADRSLIKWAFTSVPMRGLNHDHSYKIASLARGTRLELLVRLAVEHINDAQEKDPTLPFTIGDLTNLVDAYNHFLNARLKGKLTPQGRVAVEGMASTLVKIYDVFEARTRAMKDSMQAAFDEAAAIQGDLEDAIAHGHAAAVMRYYLEQLDSHPDVTGGTVVDLHAGTREVHLKDAFISVYHLRNPQSMEELVDWLQEPPALTAARSRTGDPAALQRNFAIMQTAHDLLESLEQSYRAARPFKAEIIPFEPRRREAV